MIEWIVIILLIVIVVVLFYEYSKVRGQIERDARTMFDSWRQKENEYLETWKATELDRLSNEKGQLLFNHWKDDNEVLIREDAIKRSQAVTRGKVAECLIPYFPDFPYNPKDARFLGTPVDLIVFDGLSDEEEGVKEVAFIEIKTGKTSNLSKREKAVRDCIEDRRVRFYTIYQHVDDENNQMLDMKIKG